MTKQRIYFEWFGMMWSLTPEALVKWCKDAQASKGNLDIGRYGRLYKAKKYPKGVYKPEPSSKGSQGPIGSYYKEACVLNMTDWEMGDVTHILRQTEEYLAGQRKYIESYRCR